jgi:hypothetical protein
MCTGTKTASPLILHHFKGAHETLSPAQEQRYCIDLRTKVADIAGCLYAYKNTEGRERTAERSTLNPNFHASTHSWLPPYATSIKGSNSYRFLMHGPTLRQGLRLQRHREAGESVARSVLSGYFAWADLAQHRSPVVAAAAHTCGAPADL